MGGWQWRAVGEWCRASEVAASGGVRPSRLARGLPRPLAGGLSAAYLLLALRAFLGVALFGDVAFAAVLEGGGALGVERREAGPLGRHVGLGEDGLDRALRARTPRSRCSPPGRCRASSRPGRSTRPGRPPRSRCTCSRSTAGRRCESSQSDPCDRKAARDAGRRSGSRPALTVSIATRGATVQGIDKGVGGSPHLVPQVPLLTFAKSRFDARG